MANVTLNIISTLLGATVSSLSLLAQTSFWQRKEYRLDRARAQWDEITVRSPYIRQLIFLLFFVSLAWLSYLLNLTVMADVLGWFSLISITVYSFLRTFQRGIYRPKFTLRASTLLGTATITLSILIVAIFQPHAIFALQWISIVLAVPIVVCLINLFLHPIFGLKKKKIIKQATIVRAQKKISVIGITGSYGKTTTKYFLRKLLQSNQRNIHISSGRRNEAYAVALDFLSTPLQDNDVYICEMGAYRPGEIKSLAQMLKPNLGVVTAIANQHLALFGSLKKLAASKWELIQNLPIDGIAVLNIDYPAIRSRINQVSIHCITYSSQTQADVYARDIIYHNRSTSMTICCGNICETVTLLLPGEGYATSAIAATAAAFAYGISSKQIFQLLPQLTPIPQTMQIKTGKNGVTIIDDSYSTNEASALSAIKHLSRHKESHKIVVLTPPIELGNQATMVNQAIGRALATSQATVYINSTNHQLDLEKGFAQALTNGQLEFFSQPELMAKQLSDHLTDDTIILLEGRLPQPIHNAVLA